MKNSIETTKKVLEVGTSDSFSELVLTFQSLPDLPDDDEGDEDEVNRDDTNENDNDDESNEIIKDSGKIYTTTSSSMVLLMIMLIVRMLLGIWMK